MHSLNRGNTQAPLTTVVDTKSEEWSSEKRDDDEGVR